METKRAELIFIPSPGLSHLVSTVETAKLLLHHHPRLAATVLLIPKPSDDAKTAAFIQNTSSHSHSSRLKFINLPKIPPKQPLNHIFFDTIDNQHSNIRATVSDLIKHSPNSQFAGLVLDIFCTKFIDVAEDLGLPSYLFFTASASTLGLFQYLVALKFEKKEDLSRFKNSGDEIPVPFFSAPVPATVFPAVFFDENLGPDVFFDHVRRISEVKGIMVNTFYEMESYAIEALLSEEKLPDVYPVGPVLASGEQILLAGDLKEWLDDQPENSVVFLCFGTMGSLDGAQVREIALALEKSECRFLWSLRKSESKKGQMKVTAEYDDFGEVLPEGFLDRTMGTGRVIGWAPQVAILAHPAVGGFVSHCGWNSTLESVWFGVPMATFPLYAEQQLNAFFLVRELGVAEAIKIDYKMDFTGERPPEAVGWEVIEEAIRRVMAAEGVRGKVEEMGRKARAALVEGGSSYNAQSLFVEEVMRNIG
ncbi:putative UDP-glucose flavonoid 3-O-glucosyltransferase 3 [Salvia hispanica]|uniref:putative UDP-glucose flavonoid 3-O-glucosyltransferase 3 n=1 Tax=Salvia hispanica TaxID=49212 RepID=UPI0020094600|nr:putative UDP-glucose flavonoid 3-O-glucosyltransferase 3 [Salvia hispanica]